MAEVGDVARLVLNSIHDNNFDESVEMLNALFPDGTVVAALDLVDRDGVVKYKTSWGRCHYEVLGSTCTYSVFPRLDYSATVSSYCTCPAFAFAVLASESHLMCKHVLAACLAEQLSKCVERPMSDPDLVIRLTAHIP